MMIECFKQSVFSIHHKNLITQIQVISFLKNKEKYKIQILFKILLSRIMSVILWTRISS